MLLGKRFFPRAPMNSWPDPTTLTGKHAALVPLALSHEAELAAASDDGNIHALWYTAVPTPANMRAEIERRFSLQKAGSMLPFSVRDLASGKLVGMTTYMNIDAKFKRVEIGSTWYAKSAQRSPINTECKLMLLGHAFEALECIAVEFRTSAFNYASRRAIERLGAKHDGVLRNHQRHADGSFRDTYVYSILPHEWAGVKAHLQFQLTKPR
jgi:N-acetyltransferase